VFTTVRRTAQFDLNSQKDRFTYDEILNDPLCTIIEKIKEKMREESRDGEEVTIKERLVFIVTWEEKKLC